MKKYLSFLIIMTVFLACLTFQSSALTVNDTYSDVVSTSTQANNLLNMAIKYKSFSDSEFVIFCDQQYSYYIVWGDLVYSDGTVTGNNIEYIRYYRTGSGTSYEYTYSHGSDTSFRLSSSNVCTSNIDDFGMRSATYDEYMSNVESIGLLVLIGSFLFVMTLIGLRSK